MGIHDGQRIAHGAIAGEVAFEVRADHLIGSLDLRQGSVGRGSAAASMTRLAQPVAPKNATDGARSRNRDVGVKFVQPIVQSHRPHLRQRFRARITKSTSSGSVVQG